MSAPLASRQLRLISSRSATCTRCLQQLRLSSTTAAASTTTAADSTPALLAKIRQDMKEAMRAKDKDRLAVIRSIISETNQLASSPQAIRTDMQVLALLKKRRAASQAAAKEAEGAGRQDLKEKQDKEIAVLDEYTSSVALVGEDELRTAVQAVLKQLQQQPKLNQGMLMKELLKDGGLLAGKPVDKAQLASIAGEELASR
ncbi:hypothetical protein DV735_g942, partial [Chaetothyriales sp. CBS 134920]